MDEILLKRAKKIIGKIFYVTLATVSKDGQPWNSPVFSAYDQDYNFYWGSYRDSQHSKNIRATGKAFLVIYDSTVEAGMGEGVYIQARVKELENPNEISFAHKLLQTRRPSPYWKIEQVKDTNTIRLYKAIPEKIWINAESDIDGNYIDTRVQLNLKNFKKTGYIR